MNTAELAILDIPRYYTALAEWLACMLYALRLKPRLPRRQYRSASVLMLLGQTLFLTLTGDVPIALWLPCMAVAVGAMHLLIMLLCDVPWRDGLYFCMRAFMLAEFAAAIEWQIHCFFWPEGEGTGVTLAVQLGLLALVYCVIFGGHVLLEPKMENMSSFGATRTELYIVMTIAFSAFSISNMSFIFTRTPFSGQHVWEIFNIRTLMDAVGVVALYAYHIQREASRTKQELEAVQSILENQYAQYKMSRDSIDMINRKYHDLKHQIAALRAEPDAAVRGRWLDEMEQDIAAYEAQNKTGNGVLDTVLTGKSLYCQKHHIKLTCVADGKLLDFIDTIDICTIFGNALDNAIECVRKLKDYDKRIIHVTVTSQKDFLLLRFENYCELAPQFREGLPVTTKEDNRYHGYGIKSIRYTAEKYGGTATTQFEKQWFELKVIIPLAEPSTAPR